ncbi:glycosyltransferase [Paenibacillus sp. MER TA 81-3]|uniref:glycosyltransferase n=1 Tax=Paenibacillus sp. MER TA 81-3 TaxID=2939573 RepID=UPI00203C3C31|nr:glycosyltransferase [Paenibacillus sp. MER TA 81-3]MCM3337614.1 glycosyltransferase [Paenibacillus sp. MER TA 81-3]
MNKRIIFTGGGSAGHVAVNLVLIPRCIQEGWDIHYIGSEHGIERQLVAKFEQVHYHAISTGKLRRYFAWANVTDVFKIIRGVFQACDLMKKLKPDLVFSQGGFIPHASGGTRTGQILNAENFQQAGYAKMLLETHLTGGNFMESLFDVYQHREAYIRQMKSRDAEEALAVNMIMGLIKETVEKSSRHEA